MNNPSSMSAVALSSFTPQSHCRPKSIGAKAFSSNEFVLSPPEHESDVTLGGLTAGMRAAMGRGRNNLERQNLESENLVSRNPAGKT